MGASSSCKIFETFSTALQWVMKNVYHVSEMSYILDDFFFWWGPLILLVLGMILLVSYTCVSQSEYQSRWKKLRLRQLALSSMVLK
jgi:type II secretory pathway component PulF